MKLRKYENIMLEIEELNKDKEDNLERLEELSALLATQKAYIDKKSVEKIENLISNEALTKEELYSLEDLLKEKKLYVSNEDLINEVIEGNYDNVHQKRKVVAKKFVAATSVVALVALMGLGLHSCAKKDGKKDDKVKTISQGTTTETEEDIPEEVRDVLNISEEEKGSSTKEETNKVEETKTEEESKDNSKTTETVKQDKETENTTEKENTKETEGFTTKEEKEVTTQKSEKPVDTVTITNNSGVDSEKSSKFNNTAQTIVTTVTTESSNTNGKLSIEPSTIIRNEDTSKDKKDTTVEIKNDTTVPSTGKVTGNDEITYDIPDNSKTVTPYTGTEEDKKDTVIEEPYTGSLPSLDKIDETNEEIIIEEPYTGDLPSFDNIEENTVGKVKTLSLRL